MNQKYQILNTGDVSLNVLADVRHRTPFSTTFWGRSPIKLGDLVSMYPRGSPKLDSVLLYQDYMRAVHAEQPVDWQGLVGY